MNLLIMTSDHMISAVPIKATATKAPASQGFMAADCTTATEARLEEQ
jgi:hypothetical protein